MSRHKTKQRITAMMLSVIMLVGMMPASAFAETSILPSGTSGEILAFETLELDISFQHLPFGTAKEDLRLPDTLTATLQISALDEEGVDSGEADAEPDSRDEITVSIPVTWTLSTEYDSEMPGIYVFTPTFPDSITVGIEIEVPTINIILHSSDELIYDEDFGLGLPKSAGTWVLQQLAAGAVSYVGGVAMEEAMAQIFGRPANEIGDLISEFQDIKKSMEKTEKQINELISKVDQVDLKNDLRTHWELMNRYTGVYGALCGSIDDMKGNKEVTNYFLTELYNGADENFKVDGLSIINATTTLGNALTRTCVGGNHNIFGAFDKLEKYTNSWEHQGYDSRQAFREEAILTYSLFSTMSQLACETIIANNQGDSTEAKSEKIMANRWLKYLQENALKVAEMNGRCAVIEHPNLRIYRDTKKGVDLYSFYKSVQRSYMYSPGLSGWNAYTSSLQTLSNPNFLLPVTHTDSCRREDWSNGDFEIYSNQPSIKMYERIYEDYKGNNGGKHINLYNIFFDQDKGNFVKPSGTTSQYFATHTYNWTVERLVPDDDGTALYGKWTTYLMDGEAYPDKKTLISATYGSPIKVADRLAGSIQYLSPMYYYGDVEQGMLMLPGGEYTPEHVQGIVIFDLNGGTRTGGGELIQVVDVDTAATAPTVSRSNYTFAGWDKSFDHVTSDMTVTAIWNDDGASSGSSSDSSTTVVTPPATANNPNPSTEPTVAAKPTVSGDTVNVAISNNDVNNAISKAQSEAKKNGTTAKGIAVEIKVDTKNTTATNLSANLLKASVDALVKAEIKEFQITSNIANISFNLDTLKEIQKQLGTDVTVTAKKVDNSTLSDQAKKLVGDRPVYDFSITGKEGREITDFGNGTVSVSIPYTLGENENAAKVVAYYIDSKGNITQIPNSVYDPITGTLSFVTNHFSQFAVGYNNVKVSFTDTTNHWAKESIEFVVARGLFSRIGDKKFAPYNAMIRGMFITVLDRLAELDTKAYSKSSFRDVKADAYYTPKESIEFVVARGLFSRIADKKFAPNNAMNRGVFVTALGRLAELDTKAYSKSSFTDVKADAYYAPYVEWASKNGIVSGVGSGKFAPNQSITREQMAVIMASYAKVIGFELPKVHVENTFADNGKISSYAKEAVKAVQMAGIISGKNGNIFDPQGTATRAEVSVVLKRFVELAISTDTAEGWTLNDSGKWMYYEIGKPVTGNKNIDGTTYTFDQYGVTPDVPKPRKYGTYTVQKGDSFWLIAYKHGCTMKELEVLNNKSRFSLILPGEGMKVSKK